MGSLRISKKTDSFPLPFAFVDKFLREANAAFVKVYIYALRHAHDMDAELTVSSISNALNLIDSDVIKAFEYWDSVGAVAFKASGKDDFELEFLDIDGESEKFEISKTNFKTKTDFHHGVSSPSYSIDDVNRSLKSDKNIKNMFDIAQQILNKTLNHNDLKKLYSFYDWLGLPYEVILMLLEYCVSLGKSNMQYIEKVACTWADNNINTLSKANEYIKKQFESGQEINKIKKVLNIYDRELTNTEISYIESWLYEYKADIDKIKEAYELTVLNTGKLAFKYMDAVIKNGIGNTLFERPRRNNTKVTTFSNYTEDDELSDFEMEVLKRRLEKTNGTV